MELAADQLHALLHTQDPNADFVGRFFLQLWRGVRGVVTMIDNFQQKIGVVLNSYLSLVTSRMALDISEPLLHDHAGNACENGYATRHGRRNVKRAGNPWRAAWAAGGFRGGDYGSNAGSNDGIHRQAAETARRADCARVQSVLAGVGSKFCL
jgi:hypothetical protein